VSAAAECWKLNISYTYTRDLLSIGKSADVMRNKILHDRTVDIRLLVSQEKQQLEADVADAKRSTAKLRQRLTEMRVSSDVTQKRMMTLMLGGQSSTSPAVVGSSAGGDCSGHSSSAADDDAPADHQQVSLPVLSSP